MLVTCWSVKGGSGTTVVAAALGVLLGRRLADGALLLDAGGDLGCTLGVPERSGPGLADWLRSPAEIDVSALERLSLAAAPGLTLVPRGAGALPSGAADRLLEAVAGREVVIVDAGPPSSFGHELAAASTLSLLVLRPCFLALRRALAAPVRPSGVVLVEEPRRALDAADVESVLGVPVHAVVPWDPAIARAVDAGLLGSRLPRPLATALREAA